MAELVVGVTALESATPASRMPSILSRDLLIPSTGGVLKGGSHNGCRPFDSVILPALGNIYIDRDAARDAPDRRGNQHGFGSGFARYA